MVITPDGEEFFCIIYDNSARAAPVLLYISITSSQENIIRISNPYSQTENNVDFLLY